MIHWIKVFAIGFICVCIGVFIGATIRQCNQVLEKRVSPNGKYIANISKQESGLLNFGPKYYIFEIGLNVRGRQTFDGLVFLKGTDSSFLEIENFSWKSDSVVEVKLTDGKIVFGEIKDHFQNWKLKEE